ncbi:MAG TPA: SpoIID/LytB domain-containing protein [Acidimicrobiales bacterium]|nr:SpoIID/LytB domain-containing protein [Acidimicrobiales bacterium]
MRRALVLVAAVALVSASASLAPPARAAVPVLVLDGRGFGHGVGMAQDGALSMGQAGATYQQILGQFYPGTAIARRAGYVRVPVLVAAARVASVTFPDGGQIRDTLGNDQSPGFPIDVAPGGRARITFDGTYHVDVDGARTAAEAAEVPLQQPAPTTTAASPLPTVTPPPPPTPPSSPDTTVPDGSPTTTSAPPPAAAPAVTASSPRPILSVPTTGGTIAVDGRGRRYRGFVEANAAQGPLRLVNQVDVEQYLRGMGEVRNPKWPLASLKTQAIAARTYALRAMSSVGEICEDQRCQVYLGAQAEYPQMDRAVRETQGQVLTYRGALASTVYSANGGGFEASPAEGFGPGSSTYPYLRAAPYPSKDPAPWTVKIALSDLARRMAYRGTITNVRVSQTGPSGRAMQVALDGTAGTKQVAGVSFDRALGLKSTLFAPRIEQADVAPPPPAAEAAIQSLPDQVQTAPPPSVPPDTPLEQLGIPLRTTTTSPLSRAAARSGAVGAARLPASGDSPWRALAVFLLITAAAAGAVLYGTGRDLR